MLLFVIVSTIEKIKEVRNLTGFGVVVCKRALINLNWDVGEAVRYLKSKYKDVVLKEENFTNKAGAVFVCVNNNFTKGVLLELSCETDFVAKSSEFLIALKNITNYVLKKNIKDVDVLYNDLCIDEVFFGMNFKDYISSLIVVFSEKIQVRRFEFLSSVDGIIGAYIHYRNSIPCMCSLVSLKGVSSSSFLQLANDLAIHVVAEQPKFLDVDVVSDVFKQQQELLIRERLMEQFNGDARLVPYSLIDKELKFILNEVVFLKQKFVLDTAVVVGTLLRNKVGVVISDFKFFKVGG